MDSAGTSLHLFIVVWGSNHVLENVGVWKVTLRAILLQPRASRVSSTGVPFAEADPAFEYTQVLDVCLPLLLVSAAVLANPPSFAESGRCVLVLSVPRAGILM